MDIVRFLLVASFVLLATKAAPQDFSDLFTVYAGNLTTSVQYLKDAKQTTPVNFNITEEYVDFDDDEFMEGDDDGMEDFFYENGFVEVSNDGVYDYSFRPKKPSNDSSSNGDTPDDEKLGGDIFEQNPDDEEDGTDLDHPPSLTNQSMSTSAPEPSTVTSETMEGSGDHEHETNYDNSLNPDLPDHIIPAYVHPINRPSHEWPLNQTQLGNPNRKPGRRPPNRRPRPQGNRRRPQQGGRPQKKHGKRRRKPQKGIRRPVSGPMLKPKRKRPATLPHRNPSLSSVNKFFASGSCGACQCGVTTTRRIVGGTIAAVNEFPWLALIAFNGTIQCGGTLINDRYVLTAAHCVRGFAIRLFQIRFLEYNRVISSETPLVIRRASRIYTLNRYNANTADNDIGVIRLSSAIQFTTTTVRPICLPPANMNFVGSTGTIAGWGVTTENGSLSRILRKAKVPIISNAQCLLIGMQITNNMLCAGRLLSGGVDACQGDSGGPLMVIRNKRYYLAGIVSWGDGCARPLKPGVYTRVTRYLPWIRRLSAASCSCF